MLYDDTSTKLVRVPARLAIDRIRVAWAYDGAVYMRDVGSMVDHRRALDDDIDAIDLTERLRGIQALAVQNVGLRLAPAKDGSVLSHTLLPQPAKSGTRDTEEGEISE